MKFFVWLSWISFCVLLYIFFFESIEYCLTPPTNIAGQGFFSIVQSSWFIAILNLFAYFLIDPFQGCWFVDNKLFSELVIFSVFSLILSFMVWAIRGTIKELKEDKMQSFE